MSNNYFISDLHLGHEAILNFTEGFRTGSTPEENSEHILQNIENTLDKRDTLYILGDVTFSRKEKENEYWLHRLGKIPGRKILIRGNHDELDLIKYARVFDEVYGFIRFKGFWLSHAPIHPSELHGRINIHGHVHTNSILDSDGELDKRYVNVCCEAISETPINLLDIQSGKYWDLKKI